jgi:hypothetical protein
VWKTLIEERNVIYLSPLLFTATAVWLEHRVLRPAALAAGGVAAALLVWRTPVTFDYPNIEALGLSLPAWLHLHYGTSAQFFHRLLAGCALASVALGLLPRLGRPRLVGPALGAAAALVLAWNVGGELAASYFSRGFSELMRDAVPKPLDWVDRANGGAPTIYLAHAVRNANSLHEIEFWNRSIHTVANLDRVDYPGPGPVFAVAPIPANGKLEPDPGDRYALAEPGIEPVGSPVRAFGTWTLYRLTGPLRVRALSTGVSADGWMADRSTYARYAGPAGKLRVVVSRTGWCGPDPGGRARVRLTAVRGSRVVQVATRGRRLGACKGVASTLVFDDLPQVTPPFTAEVTVTKTFVPSRLDPGSSDSRTLGAQPTFTFTPLGAT